MEERINGVDEQILYYLTKEAWHTSAPDIVDGIGLAPPTVRNRIVASKRAVLSWGITPT